MIVLDTSFIYALLDGRDSNHASAAPWYGELAEPTITTPFVLAEVDQLAPRAGTAAIAGFRDDVVAGAYAMAWWPDLPEEAARVAARYTELGASLTDGSLAVAADRLGTTRIATFDQRDFRAIRPLGAEPAFTLLPADAR